MNPWKVDVLLDFDVPASFLATIFVAFLVKHFIADFLLQTGWMAHGKEQKTDWVLPLACHAAIHGALTALICLIYAPSWLWLGLADFVIHFVIDRSKSHASRLAHASPDKSIFWWLLGLDQSLHHLTHFAYLLLIASTR